MENEIQRIQLDPRNIHYTKRNVPPSPDPYNNVQLPQEEDFKYLGLHLDKTYLAQTHVRKTEQLEINLTKMDWLIWTQVKTLYKQQTSHILV
jgi:hypothetical protein